jgi:hypothetical protein
VAEPAQVNVSRMQRVRQDAADASRDFLVYMSFVHALIPSEPQLIVAERLLKGQRQELILGPPGCGKSTVLSCWMEWTLGLDPNYRWLILSEIINRRAAEHVRIVGDTIAANERYHMAFGQLKGKGLANRKSEWSTQALRLRVLDNHNPPPPWPWLSARGRNPETTWPNVAAAGWRAGIAGNRADAVLGDDYVSERTSNSKVLTESARATFAKVVTTRLQQAAPCPWTKIRGRTFVLGQRWMPRDFYGLLIESGSNVTYDNNPQREGLFVLEEAA